MMTYIKDPAIISVLIGRIGAAICIILAFVLQMFGYTFGVEEQGIVLDFFTALFTGVAGLQVVISKIRESKKA